MSKPRFQLLVFLTLFLPASCKGRTKSNFSQGLAFNQAQRLKTDSDPLADPRIPVFIYLANTTHPYDDFDDQVPPGKPRDQMSQSILNFMDPNWQSFRKLLFERDDEIEDKILGDAYLRLLNDAQDFNKVVKQELFEMDNSIGKNNIFFTKQKLVLEALTNAMYLGHNEHPQEESESIAGPFQLIFWEEKHDDFRWGQLQLNLKASIRDPRLIFHPLSDIGGISKVFEMIRRATPPEHYQYVLVLKSHGASAYALTTKLNVDMSKITRPELLSTLAPKVSSTVDSLTKKQGLSGELILTNEEISQRLGAIAESKSTNSNIRLGISKDDFERFLIDESQKYGMYFPVVVLEACNSKLDTQKNGTSSASVSNKSPLKNIGYLYTSDEKGLPLKSFDYRKALQLPAGNKEIGFLYHFKNYLDEVVGATENNY